MVGVPSLCKAGRRFFVCLTVQKTQQYEKKEVSECLESTAERRARRNRDIKALFQQLTVEEGFSFMDAYEIVGYRFYLSAEQIRQIIARRYQKW